MTFLTRLKHIWKAKDLRNNIFYVLALLVVFRVAAHIPLPGVDLEGMKNFMSNNQLFGFIDMFSGGAIRNFSIAAMGVAPYITASIIIQLLTMVVPSLEELSKEGESGQNKINQYTRLLMVPMCILQSIGLISLLRGASGSVLANMDIWKYVLAVGSLTAGSVFLMWLGELISEKKIGNGISLLIFAGIVAQLPLSIRNMIVTFTPADIPNLALFIVIALVTIVAIIYITEGQRNIPVSYAKMMRGGRTGGGVNTHLPLKVNQAGVIPIIFAISIVMFPPVIAQLFMKANSEWIVKMAQFVSYIFTDDLFKGLIYFSMVFAFTYFYTAIVFQPDKVAENLQKQGGFVPGIRPGKSTANHLSYISNRIMLAGALFLGTIAVLPMVVQNLTSVTSMAVGGTSLLIVISVVLETVRQIDSQMTMRDYEDL